MKLTAPSGCKRGDWCIYEHSGTAGDDNGKNSVTNAVKNLDSQAPNLVLRASHRSTGAERSLLEKSGTVSRKRQLRIQIGPRRKNGSRIEEGKGTHGCDTHRGKMSGARTLQCSTRLMMAGLNTSKSKRLLQLGNCASMCTEYLERTRTRGTRSSNIGIEVFSIPAVHRDKKELLVDSSASMHLRRKSDLTPEEKETIR